MYNRRLVQTYIDVNGKHVARETVDIGTTDKPKWVAGYISKPYNTEQEALADLNKNAPVRKPEGY